MVLSGARAFRREDCLTAPAILVGSLPISNDVGANANSIQPIVSDEHIVKPSAAITLGPAKNHDMNPKAFADSAPALLPGAVAEQLVVGGGVVPCPSAELLVLVQQLNEFRAQN